MEKRRVAVSDERLFWKMDNERILVWWQIDDDQTLF